jgi:hypothetical protein
MADVLTPAQQRTLAARQALAAKFPSPEKKSEHFRALARRSHERRLTLSGDEVDQLAQIAQTLVRIVDRDASTAREEATGAVA